MCIKTRMFPLSVVAFLITSAVLLGGDSWRKKTPDQWDEDEINQILTDSPWARQAKVSFSGRAEGPRGGGQGRERQILFLGAGRLEALLQSLVRVGGLRCEGRAAGGRSGTKPGSGL